ncbi:hypothetical protein EYF80_017547 [Liparis tanakae]|uniref:Uncharacterized protein n=1 Tax=Liparis tanakae TaxID=230148 RepID=A0A4Z2I4V3_9TELE|nr:hypothetical protein EYF80_017547 [Liparis tanakae]
MLTQAKLTTTTTTASPPGVSHSVQRHVRSQCMRKRRGPGGRGPQQAARVAVAMEANWRNYA